MNRRLGPDAAAPSELRVQGHLDESWSTWFGGSARPTERIAGWGVVGTRDPPEWMRERPRGCNDFRGLYREPATS